MKPTVLVYIENAELREKLCEFLDQHSFNFDTCYSKSSLELKLKRLKEHTNGQQKIAVVTNHDISSIETSVETIKFHQGRMEQLTQSLAKYNKSINSTSTEFDILLLGSSTGGFPIVQKLLGMPKLKKTVVIVCQHISSEHSQDLLQSISNNAQNSVQLIQKSTTIDCGTIYLLSGGQDFKLSSRYGRLKIDSDNDYDSVYHPSFNKLISSIDSISNYNIGIVVLSGLGDDGARGISKINGLHIEIFAQDPSTSSAPGMPKSAIATGCVGKILPPDSLAEHLFRRVA